MSVSNTSPLFARKFLRENGLKNPPFVLLSKLRSRKFLRIIKLPVIEINDPWKIISN